MSYRIEYRPSAAKEIEHLPRDMQRRIDAKILSLAQHPRPSGCVKLVGYDNLYRIRVGAYRIVYEIHGDRLLIIIVKVAHRGDVYG